MKAKIIYYGWGISWLFLFGGIGTMDTTELGSFENTMGLLLCGVWFVFSLLLIDNEKECLVEADKMEKWMDETIVKVNKWFEHRKDWKMKIKDYFKRRYNRLNNGKKGIELASDVDIDIDSKDETLLFYREGFETPTHNLTIRSINVSARDIKTVEDVDKVIGCLYTIRREIRRGYTKPHLAPIKK